jgi:tetratricopeptide (TPR) repeat protein
MLVGLVLVAYQAAPDNGFHFDDYANVVEQETLHVDEPRVQALVDAALNSNHPQRFVANLTLAFDWWRGNGSPRAFQWTNLLIHAIGALLVFALLKTLLGRRASNTLVAACAFFGAAWWALHPIQVQAVTYIVQRMASLAAVFVLAAVLAYVKGRLDSEQRWRWLSLAAVCGLLAALTKENAWILPLLLILAEFGVVRESGRLVRNRVDWVLILAPAAVALYLGGSLLSGTGPFAEWVQRAYDGRPFTLGERLLTQPRVIVFHFSQLAWPLPGRFSIEHALPLSRSLFDPASTLPAILLVCGWIGLGLRCLLTPARRLAGFFMLWVPATLVVESSVIGLELVFEHRMYLPSVGIAGLLAMALRWSLSRPAAAARAVATTFSVALITGLLAATLLRVPVWASDVTLLEQARRHAPDSPRVVGNLGVAYLNADRLDEARDFLLRAVELDPQWPKAWYNLALWLTRTDDLIAAETAFLRTLELAPTSVPAWLGLGDLYRDSGRPRDARAAYSEALRVASNRTEALRRRGRLLSEALDEHEAALRDLDEALAAGLDDYALRLDRGAVLGRLGRTGEALREFTVAIEREPENPRAYYDRGLTYLRGNDRTAARADFATAARLDPSYADAYIGLGSLSLMDGDHAAAREGFERALSLDPRNVHARFNLGIALESMGDAAGAKAQFERACAGGHPRACRKIGEP